MLIDTHCHLNFKAFTEDWREVADRAVAAGVTKMIVVGSDLENSRRAVELAKQHPAIWAAVGIHPHYARALAREIPITKHQKSNNFQSLNDQINKLIAEIAELAREARVVAIGEIGLDYHVPKQSKYPEELWPITEELKERQRELFIAQLQVAVEVNKPVILHSREAKEEVLSTITNFQFSIFKQIGGVFHCFGGSKKYAKRIMEAGFYVGFDGDITYVPDRLAVSASVPLDRLLLETDSPYLTPVPLRGKRNEPAKVKLVAEAQANARGVTVEEVGRVTDENAEKLFNF